MLSWKEVAILYRARWQIELVFKLWKSHSQLAQYQANWSPLERMAMFWAKLIAVIVKHWLIVMSTWSDARRSHWKAGQQIREWIVSLALVLDDFQRLVRLLEQMTATIQAVARIKSQKKNPSLFQLLENPELLNWSP
jgi:Transposase DDE domain